MDVLEKLGIKPINAGAFIGDWQSKIDKEDLSSFSPHNEAKLASISAMSLQDYNYVIDNLSAAFLEWRQTPAPKRGLVIRDISESLRKNKDLLSSLLSLEMGKTIQEAQGEVQEMIDIAEFALGQSRMLYGNTMHSERPNHRLYEQWHPYGIVSVISAFNFPVEVWDWNAFLAAI